MSRSFLGVACLLAIALGVVHADEPDRLVGAETAGIGEFPYVVSIRKNGRHMCGGGLLSETIVITAAHCVYNDVHNPGNFPTVYTGTNSLLGGEPHEVAALTYHEKYTPTTHGVNWYYDVGLMKLATPVVFNQLQQPGQLATVQPPPHSMLTIGSWGATSAPPFGQVSTLMQKLNLLLITKEECQRHFPMPINEVMHCTLDVPGRGSCNGDSGTPITLGGLIVGLTSGGIPCARGEPDIWTNTVTLYDDIQKLKATMDAL